MIFNSAPQQVYLPGSGGLRSLPRSLHCSRISPTAETSWKARQAPQHIGVMTTPSDGMKSSCKTPHAATAANTHLERSHTFSFPLNPSAGGEQGESTLYWIELCLNNCHYYNKRSFVLNHENIFSHLRRSIFSANIFSFLCPDFITIAPFNIVGSAIIFFSCPELDENIDTTYVCRENMEFSLALILKIRGNSLALSEG